MRLVNWYGSSWRLSGVRRGGWQRQQTVAAAGHPGVWLQGFGFGQLYADDVGTGTVSMQTPVMQVAAGAGCRSRALGTSNQLTRDFRTSDYVAAIKGQS
jgi:hypothetical protein